MPTDLYPLRFIPTYHYRIWGGKGLKTHIGKPITEDSIGESWEISNVDGFVSEIAEGKYEGMNLNEIIKHFQDLPEQFLGTKVSKQFGTDFPLLIKYIDAEAPLSVQVHPDDAFAQQYENSFGKTEMWYIMRAEKEATLIIGFEKGVNKELYHQKLEEGKLEDILRKVHPKEGEVYYIPAGRVHAIGAGITLAEIQQTSNITYRIYDYNRKDKKGNTRELHTEKALQVANFEYIEKPVSEYIEHSNSPNLIINSPYFKTSKLIVNRKWQSEFSTESFTIYINVKGKSDFIYNETKYSLNLGETLLIPAGITTHEIISNDGAELLMVRI